MIKFNSSPKPTIGVEIELQLVDEKNLNLKNTAKNQFYQWVLIFLFYPVTVKTYLGINYDGQQGILKKWNQKL